MRAPTRPRRVALKAKPLEDQPIDQRHLVVEGAHSKAGEPSPPPALLRPVFREDLEEVTKYDPNSPVGVQAMNPEGSRVNSPGDEWYRQRGSRGVKKKYGGPSQQQGAAPRPPPVKGKGKFQRPPPAKGQGKFQAKGKQKGKGKGKKK